MVIASKDGIARVDAHRLILASRCPYFSTLFQGNWDDAKKSEIVVDVPGGTLELIIKFIYGFELAFDDDQFDQGLIDLYVGANLLMMEELQRMCIERLAQRITLENADELEVFAQSISDEALSKLLLHRIEPLLRPTT